MSISLLVVVLLPQFGTSINSARRWLRIPIGPASISFQPSEMAKWSLIIFLAVYLSRRRDSLQSYRKGFAPACAAAALTAGLIITQDVGTAAFIGILSILMFIIAGIKLWHIFTLFPPAAAGFAAVLLKSPNRINRIKAFLNPEEWSDSVGYQANQSLIALGSGGITGKGLGKGICKYGHLPEDTTDFIFSIIGEEIGLAGTLTVILLFITLMWLSGITLIRCRDLLGRLLAGGIALAIGIQAVLNIGVVTVVLPTKGIPLPFVSAGGTSLLFSAAAAGLLLNIANQCSPEEV